MKRVALIDKAPNRTRYSDYFPFEFEHFHMSSVPITKLLKKDVDLDLSTFDGYDIICPIGAEALKYACGATGVRVFRGEQHLRIYN